MEEKQSIWPAGIRRTHQRECVLKVLENSDKPLSAAEIYVQIEKNGEEIWMSTIYRTLELFVKKSVVIKISVMNNEMAVYELNRFKHKHYAICIGCNKIIEMDTCPMEKFIPKIKDEDFQIMGHNLEVFGFCKDCKSD